ncbi:MAG: response regulator [Myxococcota bacterium]
MGGRFILLVEDNPDDEALALRALAKCGMTPRVEVVRDGAEALDAVLGRGRFAGEDLPEVVLLDLKLPKLSGIDVLRRMRSEPRTEVVPVVVLTSSSEDRDIVDSYRAGANSYVRKPVDFEEFTRAVRELGHFWLSVNESPNRPVKQR